MYTVETKQLSATTRSLDALWEVATSFDLPSVSGDLAKDTRVLLGKKEDVSLTSLAVEPTVIVYDSSTSIAMYEMHEAMLVASFAWSAQKLQMLCADGCGGAGHLNTNFYQGENLLFQWSEPSFSQRKNPWESPNAHDHDDHEPCKHCKKKDCHGECQNRLNSATI